jgi:hypothetical protein
VERGAEDICEPSKSTPSFISEDICEDICYEGLQIVHRDGGERLRIARRNDGHLVGHRRTKGVEAEQKRCAVSFSLAILLGCRNQSRRRAAE